MSVTMDHLHTLFMIDNAEEREDIIENYVQHLLDPQQVYINLLEVTKGEIDWSYRELQLFGERVHSLPETVSGTVVMVYSQSRYTSARDINDYEERGIHFENRLAYEYFRLKYVIESELEKLP